MSIVDIPLSMFTGEKSDILEQLYEEPKPLEERDTSNDYEKYLNLEPPENYNPSKVTQPSYFYDDELEPIFGTSQICIYDKYYLLYEKIKQLICDEIESHSIFRISLKKSVEDNDDEEFEFEITEKENVKNFIANIVTTVPCSLYEIVNI
jgi:hypothetical protein